MNALFWWVTVALVALFGCIIGAAYESGYSWVALVLGLAAVAIFILVLLRRKE